MSFEKIGDGAARKLEGSGLLRYSVWEDKNGAQYVQIVENDEAGTFSRLLFSVDGYGPVRTQRAKLKDVQGVDLQTGMEEPVSDNNVGAFLKAILIDLIDNPDAIESLPE